VVSGASEQSSGASAAALDLTRLPLGDERLAASPQVGWIWPCRVGESGGGGAGAEGPWFNGDGTYDGTAKASVAGAVSWPASFSSTLQGDARVFAGNNLPDHPTGIYPVQSTDPAYQYDRNPSSIAAQDVSFSLPANPVAAGQPSCVPGGIGIMLSGSVLFNALDATGRDAVAHELQDGCQGHPQRDGVYHYHNLTSCISDAGSADGHSALLGYILDGFGLYGQHGVGGATLSSADLDACHGHTHQIEWDGQLVEMYHYHATSDFPYTVGCIRGAYDQQLVRLISGGGGETPNAQPGDNQPAPDAAQPPSQPGDAQPPAPGNTPPNGQPGPGNAQPGGGPDLAAAAARLGVSEQALREALGPPPPDLAAAAVKLGVSEQALREALGVK
jgi:hypothetical protein